LGATNPGNELGRYVDLLGLTLARARAAFHFHVAGQGGAKKIFAFHGIKTRFFNIVSGRIDMRTIFRSR